MENQSSRLKRGQLVKFDVTSSELAQLPFATTGMGEVAAVIYERIDLESYPGWNDFHGGTTEILDDDVASIIRYVGRPIRITCDERWSIFDVYEILVAGSIRQVFRCNLQLV